MSIKYIDNSAYATSGYTLDGANQSITIGPAGVIGGPGIVGGMNAAYTIVNKGTITGTTTGVSLQNGGMISNAAGGTIAGYKYGIFIAQAAGHLANSGTVQATDSFQSYGVVLDHGGSVNNATKSALIEGYDGVVVTGAAGAVANAGTILGMNNNSIGVLLLDGGSITNAKGASIEAVEHGVGIVSGTVSNAGLIEATATFTGSFGEAFGIGFTKTGSVTNAAGGVIQGQAGVYFKETGTVTNSGRITGADTSISAGVFLDAGGQVINNAGGVIQGVRDGVFVANGIVRNAGHITASDTTKGTGVYLDGRSSLVNEAGGVIQGAYVAALGDPITNLGTMIGVTDGVITSHIDNAGKNAVIKGDIGVLTAQGTVINYGTIIGSQGTAVSLENEVDLFVDGAGGVFEGVVQAAQGTMELAGSGGTLTGLGKDFLDFALMVELPTASWTFTGTNELFGGADLVILEGKTLVKGAIAGKAGQELVLQQHGGTATFDKGATVTVSDWDPTKAAIVVATTLSYAGRFVENATAITVAGHTFSLTGDANLVGGSLGGAKGFLQTHDTTVMNGFTVKTGATWQVFGPVQANKALVLGSAHGGTGTLAIQKGGLYDIDEDVGITVATGGKGILTNAGTLEKSDDKGLSTIQAATTDTGLILIKTGTITLTGAATFTGGTVETGLLETHGAVALNGFTVDDGATWQEFGALTEHAGLTLGSTTTAGTLNIEQGAVFDIVADAGIAMAAGAKVTLTNAGTLEKTGGTGTSLIQPALANNGAIEVTAGTLELAGAITGTATDQIGETGTLKFDGAVAATQTVKFDTAKGGRLILDDPTGTTLGFAGTVQGFTGQNRIDLATFAFSGTPRVGFTQNGAKGTLTVTDGGKTARITLFGQYAAAGFHLTKDGGTGTLISYTPPPAAVASLAPPQR